MVNLCNPQNCIKFKFVSMFLCDSVLWSLTNSKPSKCKKCYFLFTSSLSLLALPKITDVVRFSETSSQ